MTIGRDITKQATKAALFYSKKLRTRHKMAIGFMLFAVFSILVGKTLFVETEYFSLYLYGVSVTAVLLITFYYAIFEYEDPAIIAARVEKKRRARGERSKKPLVSCMVAVFNEEEHIEQCILSLVAQSYANKEIIFVNDGSTDGTAKILNQYAKGGTIRVIHQENAGKKKALARAMREARGEIFAFSDSDSVWAHDVLEKIVPIFTVFPRVGAVAGHFRLKNSATNLLTRAQDAWIEGQFAIRKAFESHFGAVTCVSGPLAVFRRDAIFKYTRAWEKDEFIGQEFKFATDRTLTGYVLGDKYIEKEMDQKYGLEKNAPECGGNRKNWTIVYAKSAKAWTLLPDNFDALFKQHIRWKKSFIRNTFFTGAFYWKKPFLPALVYYLHVVFVLAGPFIAFRHLVYLPAHGDLFSVVLYLGGIVFIGFMFGLAYRIENRDCHIWVYRPLMSLLSTLVLSWLIFYSALTIKKKQWHRN